MGNQQASSDDNDKDKALFVYGCSDLHTDHAANAEMVEAFDQKIPEAERKRSALIVAGDISSELSIVEGTLTTLKRLFAEVLFVAGNNELRLTKRERQENTYGEAGSLGKLSALL